MSSTIINNNRLIAYVVNKEEFEENTKHRTAAYIIIRDDEEVGLTYKLPLETSYANKSNKK
ncbi:MAG: palindromic element RPE1 domain-containing protein [Rickettsia endosymbiont of Eriopis connexa]|nr:palindromic element RPE1 domain-containing protein [Rickettsia endosymbiont of Eriopis connexa]